MRDEALIALLRTVRDAIDEYLSTTESTEAPPVTTTVDVQRPYPRSVSSGQAGQVVVSAVAERTGYPEDMLDLDLDVEADLGIDSIKQAAIYADACYRLGIPTDPEFKVRNYSTLRKLIAYFAERFAAQDRQGVGSAL